jgi:ABC-type glycerol-3-phosphate transport system permease component
MKARTKKKLIDRLLYTTGTVVTLLISAPLLWLISTSIRPLADVVTSPPTLIPRRIDFSAYVEMWKTAPFLGFVLNSLFIACSVTILVMLLSCLAAYALRRFRLRYERLIIVIILVSQAMPGASLIIPVFKTLVGMGLVDTRVGLILLYTGFLTPFSTWLLYGYFKSVPIELMESALIDGMSHLQVLFQVVVPLSAPALVATAIFAFLGSWNEFVFALILTRDQATTVPVGLFTNYFAQYVNLWNQVAAASVVISIPPVMLFLIVQRQMVSGLTAGAVKG